MPKTSQKAKTTKIGKAYISQKMADRLDGGSQKEYNRRLT